MTQQKKLPVQHNATAIDTRYKPPDLQRTWHVQDTIYKTQDTRLKIQETRYKTQDTRHKIQDTRYKIKDTRYKIQDTRYKIQDKRYKIQDTRHNTYTRYKSRQRRELYQCSYDTRYIQETPRCKPQKIQGTSTTRTYQVLTLL